jgi:D-alanyl-D-alanine carboxypeptidase
VWVRITARLLSLVAVALALAAPPVADARSAAHADKALDRGIEQLVEGPGGPPGAIVLVHRNGVTRAHRAGVANIASRRPWHGTDHMRIASVAKAFSGAVTLSLVESGKLHLDDTIGELIPGQPATWSGITLRQLLAHRSGLPDFSGTDAFLRDLTSDLLRHFTPLELLAYAAPEKLNFTPGTSYRYSNTDNIAAALMAEAVTHKPYEQLLRERVYKPLGLHATSLPSGNTLPRPLAHGYQPDPPGPPEDVSEVFGASGAWASGGIVSTAADLGRFVRGYVGGRLVGLAVRHEQRHFGPGTSDPIGPGENSAGLALFRYALPCGTVYGHTGNTLGYTQFIAASSDGRRSATVSINQQIAPPVGDAAAFRRLRHVFELASCAALAGR